ncbi:hypothetical protein ScPMuIL_003856 [Solemya velum]
MAGGTSLFLVTVAITTASLNTLGAAVNERPIVGVLLQETSNPSLHGDTYVPTPYIKYLESAGARVVPVRVKKPYSYYKRLFSQINGVLFPGGGDDLIRSEMAKTAKIIYKLAIKANDAGDYFPIWGTCQGFELLTVLTSGENILTNYDAENISLPLVFSPGYNESRLLRNLPSDVYTSLTTENVTLNAHQWGLSPKNYSENQKLSKFYQILSTNKDRKDKEFISTIEAYSYPIYGTQWHPEKNLFIWNPKLVVNHGKSAVRVAQYFADFLVSEARKSQHKFFNKKCEAHSVMENYQPEYQADGSYNGNYYFNYTDSGCI